MNRINQSVDAPGARPPSRAWLLMYVLIVLGLLIGGCGSKSKKGRKKTDSSKVATPSADVITDDVEAPAPKRTERTKRRARTPRSRVTPPKKSAAERKSEAITKEQVENRASAPDRGKEKPVAPGKDKPALETAAIKAPGDRPAKTGRKQEKAAPPEKTKDRPAPPTVRKALNAPKPAVRPLDLSQLIDRDQLARTINASSGLAKLPITGQEPSPEYNHIRFGPMGTKAGLGLAIQVWRDNSIGAARIRFQSFRKSYPEVSDNRTVTTNTFFSQYGDRIYVGYLVTRAKVNVVVSCATDLCTPDTIVKVALGLKERLQKVVAW